MSELQAHRLLSRAVMISRSPINPVPSPTASHGHAPVREMLRQLMSNPLTFVFLVWGILFIGFGLLLFVLP